MGKKVLVVDDSRFMFEEMKYKLRSCEKYEIAYYCPNGEGILDAYEKYRPDLVTVDVVMPGIDGLETARILLQEHPEAKIVMLSSLVYDDTIAEAKELGAKGFIYKPFEQDQLLTALDQAMNENL